MTDAPSIATVKSPRKIAGILGFLCACVGSTTVAVTDSVAAAIASPQNVHNGQDGQDGQDGPDGPDDPLAIARERFEQGDLETALARAREAAAARAGDARAHLLLGQILDSLGDSGADAALDRALELGSDDAYVVATAADVFAARVGDYIASGQSYLAADPRRRAEELYARWRSLEPAATLPLVRIARLLRDAGERPRARGHAFAAVARDPSVGPAHDELWAFLGAELPYEQLAGFYRALADSDLPATERARCRNYEAQVLKRSGDAEWRIALAALENGEPTTHISRLEMARGCYERAVGCARESGAIEPTWLPAATDLVLDLEASIVRVFGEEKDLSGAKRATEAARIDLEAVLLSDPANVAAQRALEYVADGLLRAHAPHDERSEVEAMGELADFWTVATNLVPDRADWWNNLGFTARDSKRYEASFAAYSRCIELSPDSVRFVNDTGLILLYHLHRDLDRAEALFRRAVELGDTQYPATRSDPAAEAEMRSAYGDALLNLGLLLTRTTRPEPANEPLDRLAALSPDRLDLVEAHLEQSVARGDAARGGALLANLVENARAHRDEGDSMLETLIDGLDHYSHSRAPEHPALAAELRATATAARAKIAPRP